MDREEYLAWLSEIDGLSAEQRAVRRSTSALMKASGRPGAQSVDISSSTTARDRIRALTGGRRTRSIFGTCPCRRWHEARRRYGASLRSGYALSA